MNLTREELLVRRSGKCDAHRMNHLMRQRFRRIISHSPRFAQECAVQEHEGKSMIHLQQDSGGKASGPAAGKPCGDPLRAETKTLPGQFSGLFAQIFRDFRGRTDPVPEIGRPVFQHSEFPVEKVQTFRELCLVLSLSGEQAERIRRRSIRGRPRGCRIAQNLPEAGHHHLTGSAGRQW